MKWSFKPYMLFYVLALISLVMGLTGSKQLTDFHIYDTYYLIPFSSILVVLAIFLMICGIVYMLLDKVMYSRKLSWWHIVGTMLLITVKMLLDAYASSFHQNHSLNDSLGYLLLRNILLVWMILLWQLIFPYNVIRGWLNKA
ncbi:hypothetical protein CLV59_11233 [Chitinophaga dinghuensis]|uniref:Uncharacterized protein n=1 Tax=Chitinophaga dinghuensis TaxID=1539050 RepID=A0A327VHY7_9BACT|nr:hypothetical protein [Chitinophaga dinghuensis]RAJ73692.1 hypothetical protein CLV59_11233 [Chitinophaga dinghuensis]